MVATGLLLLLVSFLARCGDEVQPVCLPHMGADFESGMLYMASGWGKVSEVVEPKVEVDMSPDGNPMLIADLTCSKARDVIPPLCFALMRPQLKQCIQLLFKAPFLCWSCAGLQGLLVFGESGCVQNSYPDNSPCMWNITVLEEKTILLYFTKLDVEYHVGCDCDYVSLYSSRREPISLGCGSVAILVEKRKIDVANYPGLYPRNTKCHWLIEAPAEYAVKLEFEDFAVELSPDCIYSSVAVYSDEEDENELANLCVFSAPKPVLSPGNTMLVHFGSDGENSFRGFRAHLTFIHSGLKVSPPVCKRDFAARQFLVDLKSFCALFP